MADTTTPPMTTTTPPMTTTTPPMTTTTPPRERETVVDERVVALRAMFPDYDDAILQSVLQSAGGNQDRAVDILLGMTDPSFQSEAEPIPAPVPAPVLSQTELDEQFARQLVLQEQQQQTQLWLQSHPDQARPPPGVYHSSRPHNQHQPPQQQGAADRPSEFQEQVSKIAESGKKTFANIFSKVKAKIQEFETGRPSSSSPPGTAPYPSYATHPSQQYQQPNQQSWSPPQSQSQQPAYFDPNSTASTPPNAPSPPPQSASARTPPVEGYDVSSAPAATTTTTQLQREPSPQLPSASSVVTTSTPSQGAPASTGAPIDAGKLGLMPKRPVSLIHDPASAGAATHLLDDDDDDGLEYAESPFDDKHGHSAASAGTGAGNK